MSEMTLFKGGLPSYLQTSADDATNALAGTGEGGLGARRISIKGGVFREFIGGKEYRVSEERSMNVVIIKAAPKVSRIYYAGSYTEGEAVSPTCWSSDSQRPDEKVKEKQAATCLTCPQNIKGSGQGDSRACRYQQRLAVVIDGEVDKGEVYQLVLPPTSVFGDGEKGKHPLQAYARHLKSHDTPITGVVTEMRFDTASPTPKLVFKPVRPVTEDEFHRVQELKDSPEAIAAITLTVAQTDGVKDKPAVKNALAAPKPAVQKAEVEEVEAIEEPKKAPPKKAPVANEPKLEDLVGEWDDA
jgi:hypothetical protein